MTKKSAESNSSVYVPSLQAADIYEHMIRGKQLKIDYVGMIPFSLELIKLKKVGLNTRKKIASNKEITQDAINVKFENIVQSGTYIISSIPDKIKKIKKDIDLIQHDIELLDTRYEKATQAEKSRIDKKKDELNKKLEVKNNSINSLDELKEVIEKEKDVEDIKEKWSIVTIKQLREKLYKDGFTINKVDKITGEITETKYVVYKRSASKSRQGECLFIKEAMHKAMMDWSRMGLPFRDNMKVDLASLRAYESLVGSALEGTIEINPESILIVSDVRSVFSHKAKVIKEGADNILISEYEKDCEISNDIFDGQSLMDSSIFPNNKGMTLLRSHMFKSAAFNTNIQEFLKDEFKKKECATHINYDEWELTNMFDEPILAKNVRLIICPSSLKCLKFSSDLEMKKKDIWRKWKKAVRRDGNIFGICKHEKESKHFKDNGNVMNQLSYQMLNSLPATKEDVEKIVQFEIDYFNKIKDDPDFFVEHIIREANDLNSNRMFADLYKHNKDIIGTKIFKDFKKEIIKKHKKHIKSGKVRVISDYAVLLSSPVEFLKHSIGDLPVDDEGVLDSRYEPILTDNKAFTTLFDFGKSYTLFRNPHTSPNNVWVIKNVDNKEISRYFNLTDNIVVINTIKSPVLDRLSGADMDSDSALIVHNEVIQRLAESCVEDYPVVVNKTSQSKGKERRLNTHDMYLIDVDTANSQRLIGRVTNEGQFVMSHYWNALECKFPKKYVDPLLGKTEVFSLLGGVCIDLAKKEVDIKKITKQISSVKKLEIVKDSTKKPLFFEFVTNKKFAKKMTLEEKKMKYKEYKCPMDYLQKIVSEFEDAKDVKTVDLSTLLIERKLNDARRKQYNEIVESVNYMSMKIDAIHSLHREDDDEEKNNKIMDALKECESFVGKKKIKPETMYKFLDNIAKGKQEDEISHGIQIESPIRMMNVLYRGNVEVFINAFKK